MKTENQKILIIGIARSGMAAARLAKQKENQVCVYDQKTKSQLKETVQEEIEALKAYGVEFALGETVELKDFDLVVTSPGVPLEIPMIQEAVQKGIPVIGEFEFAAQFCKAPILAITGTNGKTTTTSLVGEIMKAYNQDTYVVGNIGRAFSEDVLKTTEKSIVVAEMSSFQLETIKDFKAKVSSLLNITPDHLNRHKTMENYIGAKYRIFENQTPEDFAILNEDDPYYIQTQNACKAQVITFSRKKPVSRGVFVQDDQIVENIFGELQVVCQVEELKILGTHNVENALAAIAMTRAFGVSLETVRNVVTSFMGVAHRIEYVTTLKGVDFYNDSKATNTDAAIKGLLAMRKPVRLIAGGMDKKIDFTEWVTLFKGRVEKVYILGECKEQIVQTCIKESFLNYEVVETFEEAVKKACEEAREGECVLLSPACASWDMFESFEQRGELFKTLVLDREEER